MVKKVGASVYTSEQLDRLLENYQLDLIQLPLNVVDQRLLQSGSLGKLKNHSIEIHARSAFLQGLLLMPTNDIPDYLAPYKWVFEQFRICRESDGLSALEACIGFVQSIPQIDKIIVGINSLQQWTRALANNESGR